MPAIHAQIDLQTKRCHNNTISVRFAWIIEETLPQLDRDITKCVYDFQNAAVVVGSGGIRTQILLQICTQIHAFKFDPRREGDQRLRETMGWRWRTAGAWIRRLNTAFGSSFLTLIVCIYWNQVSGPDDFLPATTCLVQIFWILLLACEKSFFVFFDSTTRLRPICFFLVMLSLNCSALSSAISHISFLHIMCKNSKKDGKWMNKSMNHTGCKMHRYRVYLFFLYDL
jgi:hypothetical protein